MIQNSGTIGSISAIHFSTTNSINNTGTIKDEITGIRVEENSHVGNIDNSGTIEGGLAAILAPEADSNSIYSINLLGTDARLIGDVYAPSATVAIKYGAVFSTENAYAVQGFIIENGAMLNMGIGNSTTGDLASGITVSNALDNFGTLNLASGVTSTLHGDYQQSNSGLLRIGVASDSSYGKLVVDGTATLASNAKIEVDVSNPGNPPIFSTHQK